MRYFLGVDQGGGKTLAAVCAEDGTIAGAAKGGPSIFYLDDPENISGQIARRLAENILADAGLSWDCLSAACGGLTGIDWPQELSIHKMRFRDALNRDAPNMETIVTNDSIIALRAGSSAPARLVVCAGTGLNIAIHTPEGEEYTYGYFIPDRLQGGRALGRAVIEAVMEAETGTDGPTKLTDLLLAASGCASARDFLAGTTTRKFTFPPQSLVPGLLNAFAEGDRAAVFIIGKFTAGLAGYIENALNRFFAHNGCTELVYSGGVFKGNGRIITEALTKTLSRTFPRLRFVNARLEPVCGALLILLERHYKGIIPDSVLKTFEESCEKHGLTREEAE